jgi:hypothetical protein
MIGRVNTASRPHILITRAEEVLGESWDDYALCVERAGGEAAPADLAAGIDAFVAACTERAARAEPAERSATP